MKPLVLALALLVSPAIARADLVYKCKSVKQAEEKTADLRFNENGQGGSIEVDFWNGYPPISLVSAELKAPSPEQGGAVSFWSEVDTLWGYSANLKLPAGFLQQDFFLATVQLKKKDQLFPPVSFRCNRF